jgi:hypothetical protein
VRSFIWFKAVLAELKPDPAEVIRTAGMDGELRLAKTT